MGHFGTPFLAIFGHFDGMHISVIFGIIFECKILGICHGDRVKTCLVFFHFFSVFLKPTVSPCATFSGRESTFSCKSVNSVCLDIAYF